MIERFDFSRYFEVIRRRFRLSTCDGILGIYEMNQFTSFLPGSRAEFAKLFSNPAFRFDFITDPSPFVDNDKYIDFFLTGGSEEFLSRELEMNKCQRWCCLSSSSRRRMLLIRNKLISSEMMNSLLCVYFDV